MSPLSAPHGTSLATTAGITSVITVVVAVSMLGQCNHLEGWAQAVAAGALTSLLLGAVALYAARNHLGNALDLAPADTHVAGVAAARGLTLYHLGMAGVLAGVGLVATFRLPPSESPLGWIAPVAALAGVLLALARARTWAAEMRQRAVLVGDLARSHTAGRAGNEQPAASFDEVRARRV